MITNITLVSVGYIQGVRRTKFHGCACYVQTQHQTKCFEYAQKLTLKRTIEHKAILNQLFPILLGLMATCKTHWLMYCPTEKF